MIYLEHGKEVRAMAKHKRNPVYCGYGVFNGRLKPVIIPPDDFDEVQQLLCTRNALVGRKCRKTTIRINEIGE